MSDKEMNKSMPSAAVPPKPPLTPAANNIGYVSKTRGFPVEAGQTWHDMTMQQRKQWFYEHENRWKTRFSAQNRGLEANLNWTRG
jgi:hypothetical protein